MKKGIRCVTFKGRKYEDLTNSDPTWIWQGILHIINTGVRKTQVQTTTPHWLMRTTTLHLKQLDLIMKLHIPPVQTLEVRQILSTVNVKKNEGSDGIPGRAIRHCIYQLVDVFTDIFKPSYSAFTCTA